MKQVLAEKLLPIPSTRNPALLAPPENPKAISCNNVVASIAKSPRENRCKHSCHAPKAAEPLRDPQRGLGFNKHTLGWRVVLFDDADRIRVCGTRTGWRQTVPSQNLLSKLALLRREAEGVLLVPAQQELHHAVAKPAKAVVKHNGMAFQGLSLHRYATRSTGYNSLQGKRISDSLNQKFPDRQTTYDE